MNLTKKAGAGSLAHEWWHSLDNYFSRMRNDPTSYLTSKPYERGEGVRPEMAQAFADVMAAIKSTGLRERSSNLDKRRTKAYWSTDIEMSARAFESYVIAKLQDEQFSNDYLANIVPEKVFSIEAGYPYPTAGEIAKVRAGFDAFFQSIESRETDSGTQLYSVPEGLPTVSVRLSDWGKLPSPGKARLMVLRGRVLRWYDGLIGTSITSSDGRVVRFNQTGANKTLRAGEDLLMRARSIPKIIERGRLIETQPGDETGIKAVHRYAAQVRDEGGAAQALVVVVRETANGTFHYSLHHNVMEGARDASAKTDRDTKKAITPATEGNARDTLNLIVLPEEFNQSTQSHTSPSPEEIEALQTRLQTRLDAMNIDPRVRMLATKLIDPKGEVVGEFSVNNEGSALIRVAMDATGQTPEMTLDHEVVHALRWLGAFRGVEWKALTDGKRH
jgi:hypothetical protein